MFNFEFWMLKRGRGEEVARGQEVGGRRSDVGRVGDEVWHLVCSTNPNEASRALLVEGIEFVMIAGHNRCPERFRESESEGIRQGNAVLGFEAGRILKKRVVDFPAYVNGQLSDCL